MNWVTLIEMIFEMIQQCRKSRSREAIVAGMNNPGPREAFVLWKLLRKQGLRRRELRQETENGIEYLASMNDVEIEEMVAEALEE